MPQRKGAIAAAAGAVGGRAALSVQLAVQVRDALERPQVLDQLGVGRELAVARDLVPVDPHAVGDGGGERDAAALSGGHGASPRPAAAARG